ncbi:MULTISPECIES: phosphotransferase family protein [Halorussus]|uniref:phosphotransferase family protein n=1 Tax=Halorussus TaxID=1070314 RepID=UPI00209DD413|nr:phosphotransferase family protein [Halorussus vallis]USZ77958.1 phosphotransferase family protein [Halorussus vallis]USZ77993.1 phosphotransferase family protein [Halorussus vallis]
MTATGTDVDAAALESYLSAELGAAVNGTEVLHDGLNLVVAVSTVADGDAYVLRRPKKLRDASYMNGIEREYRVLERLAETEVPTPEPVAFCTDESVLGGPFFVITRLDGAAVPLGSDLPERFQNPEARGRVADLLVDTLAEIHSVDVDPFEGVCDRVTPREQVVRATERLDETTGVTGRELPTLRSVGDWLLENAPSDPEITLVHGDFRPGNVLFAGADRPEITGVLDWETAMLGDPLTELGYLLLRWRDDGDLTPSLAELRARYDNEDAIRDLEERNEEGLAPFTARAGSPRRRELVARYERRTGRSFSNERFYRAQAAFLLATVWEDLHRHRLEAGAASDWEPYVDYASMLAHSIVKGDLRL